MIGRWSGEPWRLLLLAADRLMGACELLPECPFSPVVVFVKHIPTLLIHKTYLPGCCCVIRCLVTSPKNRQVRSAIRHHENRRDAQHGFE
jgi:hypothetical protein